ncbi:PRC-barrel domain containing protein [Archangium sp.]|jgi:hypothetical protein|uniref:PRC-barrel domain containing protein n=1 Tax=Archangium sp. TaxID=1872627 RepID=UPI002ED8BAED
MAVDWMQSPFERRSIQHAMKVRDEDGTVLGKVKWIGETVLFVRQRFSRRLWAVPLSHVRRVTGSGVYVSGRAHAAVEPVGERWGREVITATAPLSEPTPGVAAIGQQAHA